MGSERERTEREHRGWVFCERWLSPLMPQMIELRRDGHDDLEWAIPAALWIEELFDGPAPASFRGLPFVKDPDIAEPAVRPAGVSRG